MRNILLIFDLILISQCCVSVKCFEVHSETGYSTGLLPQCPEIFKDINISSSILRLLQIVIYTKNNEGQVLKKVVSVVDAPEFIRNNKNIDFKNKKTVLYALGYLESSVYPESGLIAKAYLKRGYNVFVTETAVFLSVIYPQAVRTARVIGKEYGKFLVKLTEQGLASSNLELTGISLGAHVVGFASKHFFTATGMKPSRITGLDPAGPCLRFVPAKYRLDVSDAEKVDIIHTNIEGFGLAERLGHIDIYVNGGEYQLGDIPYIPCLIYCSHVKALVYWWQALDNPRKFIAVKCESVQDARVAKCNSGTNYVGLETDFAKPGVYYLATSNSFPYYRGKDGLKVESEVFSFGQWSKVNPDGIIKAIKE